jgi:hypothetical protein
MAFSSSLAFSNRSADAVKSSFAIVRISVAFEAAEGLLVMKDARLSMVPARCEMIGSETLDEETAGAIREVGDLEK